jgi:excisionase family DNA binding protein
MIILYTVIVCKGKEVCTALRLPGFNTRRFDMDDAFDAPPGIDSRKKQTYTVQEIARMLSLKTRTAYELCAKTTDFKVIKLGRNVRVSKESFDRWFAE